MLQAGIPGAWEFLCSLGHLFLLWQQCQYKNTFRGYCFRQQDRWGRGVQSANFHLLAQFAGSYHQSKSLERLAVVNYYTRKYKDDPGACNRYHGIMAQGFYSAFGKDDLSNIGNDTLVNPIDLIGVACSVINALEK